MAKTEVQGRVDPSTYTCNKTDLAVFLDVTRRRVQDMEKEGIFEGVGRDQYVLKDVIASYANFLKTRTSMRGIATPSGSSMSSQSGQPADALNYTDEKTLLTKAQREKAELEVATIKGELHRAIDVEAVVGDMLSAFRARVMGIPTKVAPMLIGQAEIPVVQDILKKHIWEALQELSEYNPDDYHARNKDVAPRKVRNDE